MGRSDEGSGRAAAGSGEDALIARHFRPLARDPGALDLTDDAAFLRTSGDDLVVTTDAIVEGVHFRAGDPPDTVARKALRVNLSDLAAKGARPAGFVMTLALRGADEAWLDAFSRALGEDATAFACPLLGGDTVATPGPVSISITAFGHVPRGKMIRRAGARVGDAVMVSGTIGDAVAGLHLGRAGAAKAGLSPAAIAYLEDRYRVPRPRVGLAPMLQRHASAAIDVSDGLAGDLAKLCAVSGVGAEIMIDLVPLSEAAIELLARDRTLTLADLVSGGDDYEIAFTLAPADIAACMTAAAEAGIALTRIGAIVTGGGARFLDANGDEVRFASRSFSHF